MQPYSIKVDAGFSGEVIQKGVFLVIKEAKRIPPHIGIMFNGNFSSLTIKGHEMNVRADVFMKNISLRKIPSLFIRIIEHPVFSLAYLEELFQSCIAEHKRVEAGAVTCLYPVRQFFKEGYHVNMEDVEFIYDLLPRLEKSGVIAAVSGTHLSPGSHNSEFTLPLYSREQIDQEIAKARAELRA